MTLCSANRAVMDENDALFAVQLPHSTDAAHPPLLQHLLEGIQFGPLLGSPDRGRHRTDWRRLFVAMINLPPCSPELADQFHNRWHVCHHLVRELVEDDELLLKMLWIWLPRYEGDDLVLFRGENVDRFEKRVLGSAWTDREDVAERFASGLNAVGKGGVVLRAVVSASAIIAGPSRHSKWLGEYEYTVDIRQLKGVDAVATYPAIDF